MTREEIENIVAMQKEFFLTGETLDVSYRLDSLKNLYTNIQVMQNEICEALYKDLGKSSTEAYMSEVGMVLSEIRYMIKHVKKFAKEKRVKTSIAQFCAKSFVKPSPYGVVLILSPWNYPFLLTMQPLVDAISAGNTVICRSSEHSPNVTRVMDKLIRRTFRKEHVYDVLGGVEESTMLLEQKVDYIFFTGSTRVGKIVLQKASENFVPVTLEMGGKSPCIVDKTADLKLAAKRIVFGKFLNCGQTCVAPDYLYCDESIKDELLKEVKRQVVLQYGLDPIDNELYGKMVNKKSYDLSMRHLNEDNILFGGRHDEERLKIEPTIISANFDDLCMKEEIFGPILPVVTFSELDEAINFINANDSPLALYIFSSSKENEQKVIRNCKFGGGCINDTIMQIATHEMGFGGIGKSGMGAYHGKVGFDTFTHYKSIVDKKTWIDLPIRYQPYNSKKDKMIKMFMK